MGSINNPSDLSSYAALSGFTMTGAIQLGENALHLDEALGTDLHYSGITIAGVLGATIAVGELMYLNDDDDRWEKAQANAAATSTGLLGICLVAGDDSEATTVLIYGLFRADDTFDFGSGGTPLYVSDTTAGDFIATAPDTAGDIVRVAGYAHDNADTIIFMPSGTWVEVA